MGKCLMSLNGFSGISCGLCLFPLWVGAAKYHSVCSKNTDSSVNIIHLTCTSFCRAGGTTHVQMCNIPEKQFFKKNTHRCDYNTERETQRKPAICLAALCLGLVPCCLGDPHGASWEYMLAKKNHLIYHRCTVNLVASLTMPSSKIVPHFPSLFVKASY
ncbi:UNVERIFIED_CONTAM: hypothetical protein K2H54_040427 [Gekko kuhli]